MQLTSPTSLLLTSVFAPLVVGLLTLALPRRAVGPRVLAALVGPLLSCAALGECWRLYGIGGARADVPFVPSVHLDLAMAADGLGMFFGLLVAGIGLLITVYARGYFGPDAASLRRFYPTLGFFMTAMMGIVLSDSFLGTFLFWEMTSVSSFLLIGWDRDKPQAVRLAVQAFATTGMGGLAMLGGFILLGSTTGCWTFTELANTYGSTGLRTIQGPWVPVSFALIFVGAAAKSAQFPLHYWLPGAMAAPTPVSAYLHSATMVKAGVYMLARLFPVMGTLAYWPQTLIAFGAVTMLYGAYQALRSSELKKIFAYTTVSQLGLLVCAYGLGGFVYSSESHGDEANLIWPVVQILNHALYKAPLFIIAGAIMHWAGRKELWDLRGLLREQTLLAIVALAAGYALAGGPFTLSFIAKEFFFYQIAHGAKSNPVIWAVGVMGVLTAVCNVAIFVRMLRVFASPIPADRPESAPHHRERGFWGACIWWPAAFLIAWQFVGGIAPEFFESLVRPLETDPLYFEHIPSILGVKAGWPLYMSGIAIGVGIIVGVIPLLTRPEEDPYNRLFPAVQRGLREVGHTTFCTIQSGNFRHYVLAVLSVLLLGTGSVFVLDPELRTLPQWATMHGADAGGKVSGILLTALVCITAIVLPLTGRRIVRVLVLGACGFAVTGMYLLYQAPDLALTQVMFEIISVLLFLLVLRMLPEEHSVRYNISRPLRAVFAAAVGLGIGWIVLQSGSIADQAQRSGIVYEGERTAMVQTSVADEDHAGHETSPDDPRLGTWFLAHAYKGSEATDGRGGAGKNTVNVILVDFRGYDTLGEITVLGIAVIGVLSMLAAAPGASTLGTRRRDDPATCSLGGQPHLRSQLLSVSMRLVLPLTLIFAGYMFFKGHNDPGGGFIAGLIAAVALAVYRMSFGGEALRRLLPMKPGTTVAIGLLVALCTAVVPMLFGYAALRSDDWTIPLPGSEDGFHLTSALFFDTGVFIVVVGASVGMLNRLEEELE